MKPCFKCFEIKPLHDFYKHSQMPDGHVNKCKECNKKDVQSNYRKNHKKYAVYERERFKRRKEYVYEKTKKSDPFKMKARKMAKNAKHRGVLKPLPCRDCGSTKVEMHHHDYSKPLDVIWLCKKHHLKEHGKMPYWD